MGKKACIGLNCTLESQVPPMSEGIKMCHLSKGQELHVT
jgi:hypothetical protein